MPGWVGRRGKERGKVERETDKRTAHTIKFKGSGLTPLKINTKSIAGKNRETEMQSVKRNERE